LIAEILPGIHGDLAMSSLIPGLSGFPWTAPIVNTLRGYYWFAVSIVMAIVAKALHLVSPSRKIRGDDYRRPANAEETRYWLWNMLTRHHFSIREVSLATGFSDSEIRSVRDGPSAFHALSALDQNGAELSILPYPGGRHPRVGFQDGALFPQRETKVSLFAPWDPGSYAVADIPEAIFSDQGLIYLAHTHIVTIWDQRGIRLEPLEWDRQKPGSLSIRRQFPDHIEFGVRVNAYPRSAIFYFWLINGGALPLTRLRVQNCVLLGRLTGFDVQTNCNKIFSPPYVACRSRSGEHWIIAAARPCWRVWANPLCPCIHSDSRMDDCGPGERREFTLGITYYDGNDVEAEFQRLDAAESEFWGKAL
jgi:hypothetical protein